MNVYGTTPYRVTPYRVYSLSQHRLDWFVIVAGAATRRR
jgi:hypothetical protein